MTVRLSIEEQCALLSIHGRFDFDTHSEFRKRSEEALRTRNIREIVIDLSRVQYVDSSALGMLLVLREKAATAGSHEVILRGGHGMVKQVLEVANFSRMFRID